MFRKKSSISIPTCVLMQEGTYAAYLISHLGSFVLSTDFMRSSFLIGARAHIEIHLYGSRNCKKWNILRKWEKGNNVTVRGDKREREERERERERVKDIQRTMGLKFMDLR